MPPLNLFAYLSRSNVTWNPSVTLDRARRASLCPTSEEYILPIEHGNDRVEWFVQLSDEIIWDVKDKSTGAPARPRHHESRRRCCHARGHPAPGLLAQALDAVRVGERLAGAPGALRQRQDAAGARAVLGPPDAAGGRRCPRIRRGGRRDFLRVAGGSAAALALHGIRPARRRPSAAADAQDRLRQPEDRPARAVRRGRRLHLRRHPDGRRRGHRQRRHDLPDRDRGEGQPVRPEPGRRGRRPADHRRRDRPDARGLDAGDDQPGRRPVRGQRRAVHLVGCAVAAVVLRPRAATRPTGLRVDLPLLLGPRGHHRRSSSTCGRASTTNKMVGALWPNDGDGNAWGDPEVGLPARVRPGRLHARRPGPLREPAPRTSRPRSTPSRRPASRS